MSGASAKTSLLHQLAYRLDHLRGSLVAYLPVFISLQVVPEERFFFSVANEIAKGARVRVNIKDLLVDTRPEQYDSQDMADDVGQVVLTLRN